MKAEVVEKLAGLITGSFGLVAALAWNDIIRSLFVGPCGVENAGTLCSLSSKGPVAYAFIVTILAVIATIWIGKVAERVKSIKIPRKKIKEDKEKENKIKLKKNLKKKKK